MAYNVGDFAIRPLTSGIALSWLEGMAERGEGSDWSLNPLILTYGTGPV